MIPQIFIMLFFSLFPFAFSAWSVPQRLDSRSNNSIGAGLYLDQATNTTHILLARGVHLDRNIDFVFQRVLPDGTTQESVPPVGHHFGYEGLICPAGGNVIYSVEVAYRGVPGDFCTPQDPSSCHELYLRESKDSGATWSSPTLVARANMSDAVYRYAPSMLHIKETGRTYLVYGYLDPTTAEHSIGLLTRPKDAATWSAERLVLRQRKIYRGIGLAYTLNRTRSILQLIWVEMNYDVMYSNSTTMGLNWSQPTKIAEGYDNFDLAPSFSLRSDPAAGCLYLVYPDRDMHASLIISANHGLNWSQPFPVFPVANVTTLVVRSALCGNTLFIAGMAGLGINFAVYSPARAVVEEKESAMMALNSTDFPFLDCASDPGSSPTTIVVKLLATTRKALLAYLSTYQFVDSLPFEY